MNKLSKLLQLTERFCKIAMQALAAEPMGAWTSPEDPESDEEDSGSATNTLEQLEEIQDKTINDRLAKELELLTQSYKNFVESLSAGASKDPSEETYDDYFETLKDRWARLAQNPYLNLEPDDPAYEEQFSAQEIVGAVDTLVEDANRLYKTKTESVAAEIGLSPEEIEYARDAVKKDMGMPSAARDVTTKLEGAQQQAFNDKLRKQYEYQKTHRGKLKTINQIGIENLERQREELAQQIEQATDAIKRKQLEDLLKSKPDPQMLVKYKANRQKRYDEILKDPERRGKYLKNQAERQGKQRDIDNKRFALLKNLQSTTNPVDQKRIIDQMIALEKQILEYKKINLDDEWVQNDPRTIKLLDPKEIIKNHLERKERQAKYYEKEVSERQSLKSKGDVIGLVLKMSHQITEIPKLKKKLQNKLDSEGNKDPFFEPYLKELSAAQAAITVDPSTQNKTKLEAAQTKLAQAVPIYKNQHPLVVEINNRLTEGLELKKVLQELANKQKKTGKPLSPWFYAPEVPEDKKALLQDLIQRCEHAGTSLRSLSPALANYFILIANKLKEKLQ